MTRSWGLGLLLGLAGVGAACSGSKRLPPGLPAPEYERPAVTPWPPVDAGVATRPVEEPPAPPTGNDDGQGPTVAPAPSGMAGAASE